jgi:hypothetical protein
MDRLKADFIASLPDAAGLAAAVVVACDRRREKCLLTGLD